MIKRWIIRGIFMLPILLCLVGWGWSAKYMSFARYSYRGGYVWCIPSPGTVTGYVGWRRGFSIGWEGGADPRSRTEFWPEAGEHFSLSFGHADAYVCRFVIPYWFLILVFSAILYMVWRKTRGGVRAAAAFPVEVAAPQQSKPSG